MRDKEYERYRNSSLALVKCIVLLKAAYYITIMIHNRVE